MVFLDTNVLLRMVDSNALEHTVVRDAVAELERRGERLAIGLQSLAETRVVLTRPRDVNGFGWSIDAPVSWAAPAPG